MKCVKAILAVSFVLLFYLKAWAYPLTSSTSSASVSSEIFSLFQARILRLALEQAEGYSPAWDPSQRDCSGFVRFLYRSVFRSHWTGWLHSDHGRHDYASAEDLIQHNFFLLSHSVDLDLIRTGDLLVFYSGDKKNEDRFHLMVILKHPSGSRENVLLIYHNGDRAGHGGVRKVRLQDLQSKWGSEWRPSLENRRYKGVYRWSGWSKIF